MENHCNQRTIEGQNGEYIIKNHVTKGKHGGFARIKDIIPDDYSAESVELLRDFLKIDGSAKFIWLILLVLKVLL